MSFHRLEKLLSRVSLKNENVQRAAVGQTTNQVKCNYLVAKEISIFFD